MWQTIIRLYQKRHFINRFFFVHDDVIKWKHFPRYWPFVRSPVSSPHKRQWRGALVFFFICVWMNGWVNNRKAGDFRRYRAHHDVIVMESVHFEILLLFYWPPLQHLMMASWHGNDFCIKSTGSFVGFPHRRPVMRIIDVCFAAKLNSLVNKPSNSRWLETSLCPCELKVMF